MNDLIYQRRIAQKVASTNNGFDNDNYSFSEIYNTELFGSETGYVDQMLNIGYSSAWIKGMRVICEGRLELKIPHTGGCDY
jgi:hypothetical protein